MPSESNGQRPPEAGRQRSKYRRTEGLPEEWRQFPPHAFPSLPNGGWHHAVRPLIALSSVELTPLRYFRAIAQAGHMTRAAESLGVSQPALSAAIRKLEDQVGAELLHR